MARKRAIAAKHNASYDTWTKMVTVDTSDKYIVTTKKNKQYNSGRRIIRMEDDRTLIGARDYRTWDELGKLDSTKLLAGSDLQGFRSGTELAYIDGDYVKASGELDEYSKDDRIIKVEAQASADEYLALTLGALLTGSLHGH